MNISSQRAKGRSAGVQQTYAERKALGLNKLERRKLSIELSDLQQQYRRDIRHWNDDFTADLRRQQSVEQTTGYMADNAYKGQRLYTVSKLETKTLSSGFYSHPTAWAAEARIRRQHDFAGMITEHKRQRHDQRLHQMMIKRPAVIAYLVHRIVGYNVFDRLFEDSRRKQRLIANATAAKEIDKRSNV